MTKTPAWEADVLPLNYARNSKDLDVLSATPCVKLSSAEAMTQQYNHQFDQWLAA